VLGSSLSLSLIWLTRPIFCLSPCANAAGALTPPCPSATRVLSDQRRAAHARERPSRREGPEDHFSGAMSLPNTTLARSSCAAPVRRCPRPCAIICNLCRARVRRAAPMFDAGSRAGRRLDCPARALTTVSPCHLRARPCAGRPVNPHVGAQAGACGVQARRERVRPRDALAGKGKHRVQNYARQTHCGVCARRDDLFNRQSRAPQSLSTH
jgi:hypothetical protein